MLLFFQRRHPHRELLQNRFGYSANNYDSKSLARQLPRGGGGGGLATSGAFCWPDTAVFPATLVFSRVSGMKWKSK